MKKKLRLTPAFISVMWAGMILALGMESLVKFSTPTLTKAVGFDEGRTVFSAFNKVECVMALALIFCAMFGQFRKFEQVLVAAVAVVLSLQICWLFPALSIQVDLLLHGVTPPSTYMHSLYSVLEICKLVMLFALGYELMQTYPR